jgi:hypothetical protein
MSRPLLEWLVRGRVRALPNVELRQDCPVESLVARPDGATVTGVRCGRPGATSEILDADLVVDASGRGSLTLDLRSNTPRVWARSCGSGFRRACIDTTSGSPRFRADCCPSGDAICRFNPVYGQGMSVAAQEAVALRRLLSTRARQADPLDGLASPFFAEAASLIDTPWFGAAIPDFVHPKTRGPRPENLEAMLKFGTELGRLAARDPAVHRLTAEVQNLLKPRSAYLDPELVQRIQALIGSR